MNLLMTENHLLLLQKYRRSESNVGQTMCHPARSVVDVESTVLLRARDFDDRTSPRCATSTLDLFDQWRKQTEDDSALLRELRPRKTGGPVIHALCEK
jgi:hypothetical protein